MTGVLVVEDELMIALALETTLNDLGFERVDIATSVEQALALVPACAFTLALVDYKLGDETAEPVLRLLEARAVPFIVVTGYDDRALGDLAGAGWPILTKPTPPHLLREALAALGLR